MTQKKANSKDRTLTRGFHGWEWGMVWYQRYVTVLLDEMLYSCAEEMETYHTSQKVVWTCSHLHLRGNLHMNILIIILYNVWIVKGMIQKRKWKLSITLSLRNISYQGFPSCDNSRIRCTSTYIFLKKQDGILIYELLWNFFQ